MEKKMDSNDMSANAGLKPLFALLSEIYRIQGRPCF